MAQGKNHPQQNQSRPHQNSSQRGKDAAVPLSREERHQNWTDSKMERAKQDDFNVIQQKTRDTAETVNFLNIVDNLMYHIRMSAGTRGSKIPQGALDKYISRINAIKDDLNLVAAEMCRDTNRTYRPPRGYKNPLSTAATQKPKGGESQAKSSAKAAKKPADIAPVEQKQGPVVPHLVQTTPLPQREDEPPMSAAA